MCNFQIFDLIKKYHYIGDEKEKILNFVQNIVGQSDPLIKKRMDELHRYSGLPEPSRTGKRIASYIKYEINNEANR